MKIKYLGTAAAEGIPALFCQCDLCEKAKINKGKDIRGRSGAVLDGSLMVDIPPDIYMHSLNHNIDLAGINDYVITHTHLDHYDIAELLLRLPDCFCHIEQGQQYVDLYGNKNVNQIFEMVSNIEYGEVASFIKYHELKPFESKTISGFNVTPLPARHAIQRPGEQAFIFLFEKNNKALLYGNDTGIFFDNVFEYLAAKKVKIDLLSLDCTMGPGKDGTGHMGIPDNVEVVQRLTSQGNVDNATKCVITHFSHNGGLAHSELESEAAKYNFIVAYDGMEIEL